MGFYDSWVLPRLIDLAMGHRQLEDYRRRAVAAASGTVLEIGIGSGLNLPFYGRQVDRLYGVDPSAELLARARARSSSEGVRPPLHLIRASAEKLPIAGKSIDTVVMTWTLCSIPEPRRALAEIRRVLRPDGRLLFVEHGLAPQPQIGAWQRRLTPCWSHFSGGCHLDRKMDELIAAAGFALEEMDAAYMGGPRLFTFFYQGKARPLPAARA